MTTHSQLPDAGRIPHSLIDLLLSALQGQPITADLVIPVGLNIYFLTGSNTTTEQDGNWRIKTDSNDLVVQVRAAGTWTTEGRFEP